MKLWLLLFDATVLLLGELCDDSRCRTVRADWYAAVVVVVVAASRSGVLV